MKALNIWGWVLFAASVILYLTGLFGGEFSKSIGGLLYYGTSAEALLLSVFSAVCLLLAVTVLLVVRAQREKR